jgi:hypothetical protein
VKLKRKLRHNEILAKFHIAKFRIHPTIFKSYFYVPN